MELTITAGEQTLERQYWKNNLKTKSLKGKKKKKMIPGERKKETVVENNFAAIRKFL